MRFPFWRNRDSVKNGILISIRRTGDEFHPGLFTDVNIRPKTGCYSLCFARNVEWKDELLGQPWSKGYCIDWYGQWTSKIKSIRQYADVPAERVSLKAKLEVMKAKVAGGDTEKSMPQKTKGKEETYEIFWSFFIFIPNFIPNML